MEIDIRPFAERDIDFALAQTSRERWDTAAESFQTCLAHDPDGGFIAESAGKPVGMVTTMRYTRSAWVGNLIVVPEYRRRGIGHRLMSHALECLETQGIRTVRLEADPMGVGLYRLLGFEDQFESLRFRREPPHDVKKGSADRLVATDLPVLQTFDQGCFGDDRSRLLGLLFTQAAAVYGTRRHGALSGYAMVLPGATGVRLGPWCAADREAGDELLQTVLADYYDSIVVVGVPEVNRVAVGLLESHGFGRTPSSLRMIRGERAAESEPGKLLAIANGAMG